MTAAPLSDALSKQTLDYLDQIVCMALRAQRAFDGLPEFDIDRDSPGRLATQAKIEDGIATCRELVSRMGWVADLASTKLGASPVLDAQGWLLRDVLDFSSRKTLDI